MSKDIILGPGVYRVEEGYRAITDKGQVVRVLKRLVRYNRIQEGDYRCRDCKHRIQGWCKQNSVYPTSVCEMRPKVSSGPRPLHFVAGAHSHICQHFEYDPEKKNDYNTYRR